MSQAPPRAQPRDRWVQYPRPNPLARLRLFCFPYAGGGASIFAPWARDLPPAVEVAAVQFPGREIRLSEKPYSDLLALVEVLAEALTPHFDKPFAFFGHSNGGLVAYELARRLRRQGRPGPVHLYSGGRPAPQVVIDEPPVHALPHDEFLATLRRFAGTPEEVLQNPELMELIEPTLRADFSLGETYRYAPEPLLTIPITAYGGMRDGEVPPWQVEAWREQAGGPFNLKMFPGDHFFINSDRAEVLRELTRELMMDIARLDGPAHG